MLEQQYASLFDEVGVLSAETKKKYDELSQAQDAEKRERIEADKATKDQLKKAVAEGLPLGLLGVIFFMIGITAGTASPEIAMMFGYGACQ
jgi:hypothetical protein